MSKYDKPDPINCYAHVTTCDNCGHSQHFYIPRGQTIESFMEKQDCPNCGCKMIAPTIRYTHPEVWLKAPDLRKYDKLTGEHWISQRASPSELGDSNK